MNSYPSKKFIIDGFTSGFYLGFTGLNCPLSSHNSKSVSEKPIIMAEKINHELSLGRIEGPFYSAPFPNFKSSPLALREKKNSGKFRLLHNLSFPYDERSVNFNIPEKFSTVNYASFSSAVKIIQSKTQCYLAKSDIADAFRLIPLHSSQYPLTGFYYKGYYYDKCLPQGCSSSCQIFEKFSDSLLWILQNKYNCTDVVKVLDDFLFISNSSDHCQYMLDCFRQLCNDIGVPIAEHKTEGPSQQLSFLGVDLNTIHMTAQLPHEKLTKYSSEIILFLGKSKCTLRELKSIIGMLQFATCVIPIGKCFLRRLHDATIGITKPHYYIKLTKKIKEDLSLWNMFLSKFNGISLITPKEKFTSNELHMYSDSSHIGYGGTFRSHYILGPFPSKWKNYSIQFLELFPIFLLLHVFKEQLSHKSIIFHCDNQSIVNIINKQSSADPLIMKLLRPMILIMLLHDISFRAEHIPGNLNNLCDSLSRLQFSNHILTYHGMDSRPTEVPLLLRPHNFQLT